MKASVIIIVRNRISQLNNLLTGLAAQTSQPDEVVIIHMNEAIYDVDFVQAPVIQEVCQDSEVLIPLGKARNMGAHIASGEQLYFLDVDCIPASDWLEKMQQELKEFNGLLMGDIAYLDRTETQNYSHGDHNLPGKGTKLPFRPEVKADGKITDVDYSLFWSLNFSVHKRDFLSIGGFDENFKGYGAEDTDLAFTARNHKLPFAICNALVYHQYHDIYNPPLNHFDSIIENAVYFKSKHGIFPMMDWLKSFEEDGFLEIKENIRIIRRPSADEIAATKVTDGRSYK